MPLPNLIHAIDCDVEQIDTAATLYDPDTREPIQAAARATVITCPGQPRWTSQKQLEAAGFGPADKVSGYVLFRYFDLDARSITLRVNDRIVMQGRHTDEVYIVRLQPSGHYRDQDGASLVKAWFSDRLPAKER